MSESVDKLKALLFEPESEAIAALSRRLDSVFDRAGTTERFQASVATVLDGALREAEVERHDDLASAIAPLIVRTVKAEIHNSTDDLVEALYPATGRMVKAYVASAIKDLTDEINRRLESNPVMLRINALLTGRSAGELAIAESQRLKVEDVLLIRRATGELLARAPEGTLGSNSDHVLGGILTAINEFTTEAFKSEGSALRQIDLGDARVYMRVSPSYLLAAKCSGSAPVAAERIFDDEFLGLMDRQHAALEQASKSHNAHHAATAQMSDLASRLEARLAELSASRQALPRGIRPLPVLLTLVGLPLLALGCWSAYAAYRTSVVQNIASAVLMQEPELVGYPTEIKVTDSGRALSVSGLAPTLITKSHVVENLKKALPNVAVSDQLSAVPVGNAELEPAFAALKLDLEQRNLQRARAAMDQAFKHLKLAAGRGGDRNQGELANLAFQSDAIARALKQPMASLDVLALTNRIRSLTEAVTKLAPVDQGHESVLTDTSDASDPGTTLAILAERCALETKAALGLHAIQAQLDEANRQAGQEAAKVMALTQTTEELRARLVLTPRNQLLAFTRDHAVFFSEQTAYRDEAAARKDLDTLAEILNRDSTLLVRVVGYTDEAGAASTNVALADARTAIVISALETRKVPRSQIVGLHRISPDYNVSPSKGPKSANRRVEFEVGFVGEEAP